MSMICLVLVAGCSNEQVTVTTATASPSLDPRSTLDLPRVPWWGGPGYYSKFSKAASSGWTAASFFPIAVFAGKAEAAASLQQIGINTYMGAEHDGSPMSRITSTGMSVLAQSEWTEAEVGNDPRVVGWSISDECDMGYSDCGDDEAAQLSKQQEYAAAARGRDDGRFLQANFGNGVLGTFWSPTTMVDHVSLVDVTSVDKYAYTSPHVREIITASPHWPVGRDPAGAQAYGWLQERMAAFSSPAKSKPNWVFVETAMPYLTEDGARAISPDQIHGAVWNAIINGAAGIAYFQHNNGTCGNYSLVSCEASRAAVAEVNTQVEGLAPVLNTQSFDWSFGTGLATNLKVHQGYAYVFAMAEGGSGERTFTVPAGLRADAVEVLGENRTLALSQGTFTDGFAAEYTHHVYRMII